MAVPLGRATHYGVTVSDFEVTYGAFLNVGGSIYKATLKLAWNVENGSGAVRYGYLVQWRKSGETEWRSKKYYTSRISPSFTIGYLETHTVYDVQMSILGPRGQPAALAFSRRIPTLGPSRWWSNFVPTPSLSSTRVSGTTLTLGFDAALDDVSVPPGSAFSVKSAQTEHAVSAVAVSGRTVTLTLRPAVRAGDAVTVYYVPLRGSDQLRSAENSDAVARFSGRAVAHPTPARQVAGPLTARFEGVPAAHQGQSPFGLRLAFSEAVAGRAKTATIHVTGGTLQSARRVDERADLWQLRVVPDSLDAVTVTLPAAADCATRGAVCTADGRRLESPLSATVPGPLALRIADARAKEGVDATIDFAVTLSRAASGDVTVRYATRDGTAKKGKDYTKAKGKLTFAAGETRKTIAVPVLDDAHDEGEETFRVVLSGAKGAETADREAVGTIENDDKLQQAWLARFGRTVGTHVTDAVSERLRAAPGQGSSLTVGGYRVPLGREADGGADATSASGLLNGVAGVLGLGPAQSGRAGGEPLGGGLSPLDRPDPRLGQSQPLNLDLRHLLLGSSFRLNLGAGAGDASLPRLTAWGRFAGTTFNGQDGNLTLDGDVFTGTVGVDHAWDRLLAGIAVAHSRGDGSFTDATPGLANRGQGDLEQTLTSIHPYLRYAVTDRLDVWGLVGYGWGELDLELADGQTVETDTTLVMGAFGSRGILFAPADTGGFQLATRTDVMLTRTSSDAVADSVATDADAHRVRLILEGSRGFTWTNGRSLTPTMELGLRHDWGDAETGFGLELGGRVQYADPRLGLTVEAAARGLLAHEDAAYDEWGAWGTVRVAPGADGQGLALTLAPAWGATASGVEGLWTRQTTQGLAPQGPQGPTAGRLTAEVGYGLPAPIGRGLLTPYGGVTLAQGGTQQYRLGGRLAIDDGLTLNLEGAHRQQGGQTPADTGLLLQLEMPW